MSKVVAILECPSCGAWYDKPYCTLTNMRHPELAAMPVQCVTCWKSSPVAAYEPRAFELAPLAARHYDLQLAMMPGNVHDGYRLGGEDVRPVLEPLL